ncbi:helix-turn-helix domain-containing protein [Lichenifustis flavocetrariae]|uniref:AraC family transcriptional regulator n=1 Tax=Lichenifustis flavocetrariae TaxID=2949735 RepID=A0AA41Z170_9HYPH|nr:AraC family transcriptional regulator [Lichenifustis flavocetrariae]MCW6511844.1 AraC family transcriptional regulator [Lichenifustis flavocetrariae]
MPTFEQTVCPNAACSASSDIVVGSVAGARHAGSLLSGLMDQATAALDGDRERALTFLGRAMALLEAAVEAKSIDDRNATRGGSLAPWQSRRIAAYIESRLETPLCLDELARITCLSRSYFTRAFRRSFGTSPHNYIIKRRIERSKKRMLETTDPLSQVALSCGFTDQAHFSRVFRRLVGNAPFEWRRSRVAERSDAGLPAYRTAMPTKADQRSHQAADLPLISHQVCDSSLSSLRAF